MTHRIQSEYECQCVCNVARVLLYTISNRMLIVLLNNFNLINDPLEVLKKRKKKSKILSLSNCIGMSSTPAGIFSIAMKSILFCVTLKALFRITGLVPFNSNVNCFVRQLVATFLRTLLKTLI